MRHSQVGDERDDPEGGVRDPVEPEQNIADEEVDEAARDTEQRPVRSDARPSESRQQSAQADRCCTHMTGKPCSRMSPGMTSTNIANPSGPPPAAKPESRPDAYRRYACGSFLMNHGRVESRLQRMLLALRDTRRGQPVSSSAARGGRRGGESEGRGAPHDQAEEEHRLAPRLVPDPSADRQEEQARPRQEHRALGAEPLREVLVVLPARAPLGVRPPGVGARQGRHLARPARMNTRLSSAREPSQQAAARGKRAAHL